MAYCEIKFSSCRGLFDNLGPVKPLVSFYMAFGSFEWPKAWKKNIWIALSDFMLFYTQHVSVGQ